MQAAPERFPDVYVRPATPSDIDQAAQIVGETAYWREHYGFTVPRARLVLSTALARKEGILVADAHDEIVGVAWFIAKGAFGSSGFLKLLSVNDHWRNSHAGAALLRASEAANSDNLFLMVPEFNTAALRFYRRHGYNQVGALPGYVRPSITEVLLWRKK